MADAQVVALAKQVVTELDAGTFETDFTPTRAYSPQADLKNTGSVKVLVTCSGVRQATDNRSDWEYEYDIDVGVLYRASSTLGSDEATTTFDTYMRLLEQIADFYRNTRPATSNADCVLMRVGYGGPSGLPYFPEHVQQFNQFTGVVRLTFRQYRS